MNATPLTLNASTLADMAADLDCVASNLSGDLESHCAEACANTCSIIAADLRALAIIAAREGRRPGAGHTA